VLEGSAANDMLKAVPLLPGAETLNQTIVLEVAADRLALKAQGQDQKDWTRVLVPDARIIGKPAKVAMNRNYLLRALRFGLHEISIDDSLTPVVFTSPVKTMIVMPVRLDGPPDPPTPAGGALASQPISPPENTPVAPPSAPGVDNQTEERKTMSTTTMTPPERGNLRAIKKNSQTESENSRPAFKAALEHIDRIKTNLRDVLSDLNETMSMLRTAEKEQRASAKEIESVRAKLREIQSVNI
jgi:histone deacetylase complex regulatory component SIN3